MSAERAKLVLVADCLVHAQAGTERQLTRLGIALNEAGLDCRLAVLRSSPYTDSGQCPLPVECLNIRSLASPVSWWRAAAFAFALRSDGVRLAHLFFNDSSVLLPPFLKAAGIRVIVSRRDMGFWYTSGLLSVLSRVRSFVDRVVANSEAVAAQTATSEGYSRDRINVIHNALDPAFGAEIELSSEQPPVIGIVANIRPVKRIEDAVQAMAALKERFPDLRLRIVGGGDSAPIQHCAEIAGIGDKVEFTGPCEDPAAEMARFTIGLLTSETEGFSNTLMEYQQLGLPVVSSDGGGNPEIICHDTTGLVYPVGDVPALADCIQRLLENPSLRERLGQTAKASVSTMCDPRLVLAKYQSLYESLLDRDSVLADQLRDGR